ncbi:MAG: class I SAM-dependent methyltransferase [Pseudomonadota bacterium]
MGLIAGAEPSRDAQQLARRLDLALLPREPENAQATDIGLFADDSGFTLRLLDAGRFGPVRVSFDDPALRHRRRGGQNELIGRAIGWRADRSPAVLDATAGFGRDAFTLADLGCQVLLCERQPVMAALLENALADARRSGGWAAEVVSRMQLYEGDARELPPPRLGGIDVIYLDPMFKAPRRGLPSKDMQLLQILTEASPGIPLTESDDAATLAWALDQPVSRVVAKRPRKASPLPGDAPGYAIRGSSVRFDVYPRAKVAP